MVEYEDVLKAVIEREMEIIGRSLALRLADDTEGLNIDVSISVEDVGESGKEILEKLVEKYEDASGPVAAAIIARAISDAGGSELDLPEKIKEKL